MQLITFGLNHATAPLDVRERVVFHAESLVQALRDLVERRRVKEAAIISTCNRTEVYCNTDEPGEAVSWMAAYHEMKPQQLEPYLYHFRVRTATRLRSGSSPSAANSAEACGRIFTPTPTWRISGAAS